MVMRSQVTGSDEVTVRGGEDIEVVGMCVLQCVLQCVLKCVR